MGCFMRQDYSGIEMVILDDAATLSEMSYRMIPVRFARLQRIHSIDTSSACLFCRRDKESVDSHIWVEGNSNVRLSSLHLAKHINNIEILILRFFNHMVPMTHRVRDLREERLQSFRRQLTFQAVVELRKNVIEFLLKEIGNNPCRVAFDFD